MRFRWLILLLFTGFLASCDEEEGLIVIQNDTASPIVTVTIDPCNVSTQGPNLLDGGQIPSGEDESFRVDFGCYEVRITTADDRFANWTVDIDRDERRVVLHAQATQAL